MYSIQTPHKSSFLANKKYELRKEIRREQLDAYFASRRKQKLEQDICQLGRQKYLTQFLFLLQKFFDSQCDEEAEYNIKIIFDELTRDNGDIRAAIMLQPSKLIKIFTMFPNNRYSVQILHMMIEYCYDETFGLDDQKFTFLYNENSMEVKIPKNEMTEYQQAIDALLKTIHGMIPELQHRRLFQHMTSSKELEEAKEINRTIERRLKIYLVCLGDISIQVNSFIMRYEYVEKYLSQWAKWLLVDYNFCIRPILRYINLASRFIIPFQSLSELSGNQISKEQFLAEEDIVFKLFALCVPEVGKEHNNVEKNDILAILIIEPLFSFAELRIEVLVKFFDQIMRLLRLVLMKIQHFRISIVTKVFKLLTSVIHRFVQKQNSENSTIHDRNLMRTINIVTVMKDMEFLTTFNFYLCYEQWAHADIFKIVCGLIEYSIVFDLNIDEVIANKHFFIEICHKISHDDRQIMLTNLRSLNMVCRHAEVCNRKDLFLQMINNGVVETLQNLVYSVLDECAGHQARQLLELYFTEEQVEKYTKMQEESSKYGNEFFIPDRHEVYQV